jgi:alpha/beta superfamily hydrolase
MSVEDVTLTTSDGIELEAELAHATGGAPRAAMVLCHPHPQYGGTMRSIVISALFAALPDDGVTCLRFNFRGVERSRGAFADGVGEREDVLAAVSALDGAVDPSIPLVLAGWSFGADVALSVAVPRLVAWLAIACPLRFATRVGDVAHDPRLKLLALAERDEVRAPDEVQAQLGDWVNTRVEVVPGASHFFVGSTDRLVTIARDLVGEVAGAGPRSAG